MIQRIKNLLLQSVAATLMLAPVVVPVTVHGQIDVNCDGIENCLDAGAKSTDPENANTDASVRVNEIITLVINIFSLVVGVVAVVMIIVGGLKYITSGGEGSNITGAKNTILYAIIGLVVVALAQVLVRFVLSKATPQ